MTVAQHKVIILIPSSRRLELEKLIEELMDGVEGYRHVGTYEYDPNKPFFINRAARKTNGVTKPEAEPRRVVQHDAAMIAVLDMFAKERRPFTTHELARRSGYDKWIITRVIASLVKTGKIHQIIRGIYESK